MTISLNERFVAARDTLDKVIAALASPFRLPTEVANQFRKLASCRAEIDKWNDMIEARNLAWSLLVNLEKRAEVDGWVPFGSAKAKFHQVRLVGVQAYVAATWSLIDRVSAVAGRVLCTPEGARNEAKPPQLLSHFVERDKIRKTTPTVLFESVRHAFGWPIGLSYAIRNYFIHNGPQTDGLDFFEGTEPSAAFRISANGWDQITKAVRALEIEDTYHRLAQGWPATPHADLREVLQTCEREVDDATGVLLGSACGSLLTHLGFMLGEH